MLEWPAVRPAAVPARRRADAGLRHHGPRQPRARLALHDGRVFRRDLRRVDRQFLRRRVLGARRDLAARHRAGDDRAQTVVRPRSSRSRARHVRPHPVLQRAGAAGLGAGRPEPAGSFRAQHRRRYLRHLLSGLPAADHPGVAAGRAVPLCRGDADAARHADPRRRLQPRDGRRARRRHQAAVHPGIRARRGVGRSRRPDARPDPDRADRHGREHPDPRLCRHRHRRHRLDPRRLCRRGVRRRGRHARPRVPARSAPPRAELDGGLDARARAVLDADLPADGDRAGAAPARSVSGRRPMRAALDVRAPFVVIVVAGLALLPVYTAASGDQFVLTLFTRIVILAIAATSLNLILGYGGMVSFGHAAYLGIGGYAVGILGAEGVGSGFVQWPVALAVSGLFALVVGALSLRTRGVYFIMITLAFAQMVYYVAAGLDRYGGDDGLTIYSRSRFAGLINLSDHTQFYYLCLALLLASIAFTWRLINSRFGMVICGSRSNDRRMRAIGFPTFRYRLAAFVIAGVWCGLAGALLANHTDFVSPAMMYWTRSGDLIVMVVLGGMASSFGPLFGTVALLVLEELLSGVTEYWQIILGPLLLLVVLFARRGIDGLLEPSVFSRQSRS